MQGTWRLRPSPDTPSVRSRLDRPAGPIPARQTSLPVVVRVRHTQVHAGWNAADPARLPAVVALLERPPVGRHERRDRGRALPVARGAGVVARDAQPGPGPTRGLPLVELRPAMARLAPNREGARPAPGRGQRQDAVAATPEIEALVQGAGKVAVEKDETGHRKVFYEATRIWLSETFPSLVRFACSTWMRLSELCDLRAGSYQEDAIGKAFLVTAITKNGTRLAWPLEGEALLLVKARRGEGRFPARRLFPGPDGQNAGMSIRRWLPAVCKAAKIPYGRKDPLGITFHSFRHSMASLAINGGVPAEVVLRMGNWRTRSMLDRYAHLADETMREAAGKLASIVAGGGGHTVVTSEQTGPGESDEEQAVSA